MLSVGRGNVNGYSVRTVGGLTDNKEVLIRCLGYANIPTVNTHSATLGSCDRSD